MQLVSLSWLASPVERYAIFLSSFFPGEEERWQEDSEFISFISVVVKVRVWVCNLFNV